MCMQFGTDFPPADAGTMKRGGTTKGIDMSIARNGSGHIILQDVEGMDSITKMDDKSLEKKLALMTAATSDIVIYNMDYKDLNKYDASGCPSLQNLFTVRRHLLLSHSGQNIKLSDKRCTYACKVVEEGARRRSPCDYGCLV